MCIFHSNTYDQKQGKMVETICTEKAVSSSNSSNSSKEYCASHKTPPNHVYLKKSHRLHRSKLRNEEYINYTPKSLPTSFEISGILFTELSNTIVEE